MTVKQEQQDEAWKKDGGGGGITFEKDHQGGVHVIDQRHDHDDDGGLVFSLGREDTAKLARWLLKTAGAKA